MLMRFFDRRLRIAVTALMLSGCATLPANGPTAGAIIKQARGSAITPKFQIVDLDLAAVDSINYVEAPKQGATLAQLAADSRNDLVGPGDVLNITIYEIGVTLFGGGGGAGPPQGPSSGLDPNARGQSFPASVVDAQGQISLPYLGMIKVAGLTAQQIEQRIVSAMAGKSQDPRALVVIGSSITNTVVVSGAVNKPGRFPLTLGKERLLDAIASAGGSLATADDTLIRFSRGSVVVEQRLGTIRSLSADDLTLAPGDRVELIRGPKTYTVFGAIARIQQVPFEVSRVSLAEALARAGGPNDAQADASAIFLFRFRDDAALVNAEPIIYRLNLMRPESYFLAQRFEMRDKDVIYIANAASNQPSKLANIINQLFTPLILARSVVR